MGRETIWSQIVKELITVMLMVMLAVPVPAFAATETGDTVNEVSGAETGFMQEDAAGEDLEAAEPGDGEDEEIVLEPVTNRPTVKGTAISSPELLKSSGKTMELRSMIGEKHDGYSVVQGSCTDGTYAYYMMVSSYDQKGRLLKVRMKDNKKVGASKVVDVNHGNGICYDSKRNLIVSATYHDKRQRLAFFDADSLAFKGFKNVKFSYYKNAGSDSISSADRKKGLTAIAYNETYDCYVGMETEYHDIIIYDAESLEAIGKARTTVNAKYPATWQSMDCDDRYVYYVLSPGSGQKYNIILCLEWHSEYLQLVRKYGQDCVEKAWTCGSAADEKKRTGAPSAVKRVSSSYETESLYHVTDPSTGKAHFYLSAYHGKPMYGWVTKTVTKKVKWKKVKKKVKWKKVNGKWKYKTKKVWKYKTKTVKKKVWEQIGKYRYDYVYDLGVF